MNTPSATLPFEGLRPLVEPLPISGWPVAPVAIGLLFLLSVLLVAGIAGFVLRRKRTAYRRQALRELAKLDALKSADGAQYVRNLSEILKRAAMHAGGGQVARLHGVEWTRFLLDTCPHPETLPNLPQDWNLNVYVRDTALTLDQRHALQRFARIWILKHQVMS